MTKKQLVNLLDRAASIGLWIATLLCLGAALTYFAGALWRVNLPIGNPDWDTHSEAWALTRLGPIAFAFMTWNAVHYMRARKR